jgi:plasmid stabilization system protein ParE
MRRRRVLWSRDALDDLKSTVGYIARDNPTAAKRVASRIRKAGASLGVSATGRPGRISGTYEKVLAPLPFILVYSFVARADGQEDLVVLTVIHGARDWPPAS